MKGTVREMEDRDRKMSELGVRNIASYNERLAQAKAKGEKLGRTVQTGFDPESGEPMYEERPIDLNPLPFIRSEEHTSELQSLMRISYAVFCLKKKNTHTHLFATKRITYCQNINLNT